MKELEQSIFNKLIKNAVCQNEVVGEIYFHCEYKSHELVFGQDENENTMVDACGNFLSGKYEHISLSKEQKKIINNMVADKIEKLTHQGSEGYNGAFTQSDINHCNTLIYKQ